MAAFSDYRNYTTATDAMMYEQLRHQMQYDMHREMKQQMTQMMYQYQPNPMSAPTTNPSLVEASPKPKDRKRLDNLIAYYFHQRK